MVIRGIHMKIQKKPMKPTMKMTWKKMSRQKMSQTKTRNPPVMRSKKKFSSVLQNEKVGWDLTMTNKAKASPM